MVNWNNFSFLKTDLFYFLIVCMFVSACIYELNTDTLRGLEESIRPLELELPAALSYLVWVLGIEPVSCTGA